jgi:rubredoxin
MGLEGASERMRKNRIQAYCRRCKHKQVFQRVEVRHWLHFTFTVLTLGLWAISWVSICLGQVFRPWRCKHCGWHEPVAQDPKSPEKFESDVSGVDSAALRNAALERIVPMVATLSSLFGPAAFV